jgi:phosphate uptake regulator
MGQSAITSISLINEGIELKNVDSLNLIQNIETELDQDQLMIDDTCFDFIKNFKMSLEQSKFVFAFMKNAEYLERIGDLCFNMSRQISMVLTSENTDVLKEFNFLLIYGNSIKKRISDSVSSLLNKNVSLADESINYYKNNLGTKKKIIEASYDAMINNPDNIVSYMNLISIVNNFSRLERVSNNIALNSRSVLNKK